MKVELQFDKTEPLYTIGIAAQKLHVAVPTLRMYEKEGLLVPHKTKTGRRIYSNNDLVWVNCIRKMINENGLNLEGIRRLLSLIPCWEIKNCPQEKREKCPAYQNSEKPCWMLAQEKRKVDPEVCRLCPVYSKALHCENMKVFLNEVRTIQ